jgi:phosphocarrier protein FPr
MTPGTTTAPTSGAAVLNLRAPVSGIVVPLDQVPDPVFAQRLAGDGIAIDPLGDQVVAPCDARVLQVHRAGHAVTLDAAGLEIVIHVGLDTVQLKGEGFRPTVEAGQQVRAGEVLLRFDADLVARRARSLLTVVLVANMDQVATLRPRAGMVVAGKDVLLDVELAGAPGAAGDAAGSAASPSPHARPPPERCRHGRHPRRRGPLGAGRRRRAHGLHARPAAVVAAAARRFHRRAAAGEGRARGQRAQRGIDHGARGRGRRHAHRDRPAAPTRRRPSHR